MINSNNKDTESLWYEQIAEEIEKGEVDKGLWTKAISLSDNDSKRIESEYIKLRFSKLKEDSKAEKREIFAQKLTSSVGYLSAFVVFVFLGVLALGVMSSFDNASQSDLVKVTAVKESPKEDIRTIEIQVAKKSADEVLTFSDLQFESLGQSVPEGSVFYNVFADYNRKNDGYFLHASILVTNDSASNEYISIKNANLSDDRGRQFELVRQRRQCKSDMQDEAYGLLKPYIPCQFDLLFEVPPDIVTGKLEIEYAIRGGVKNDGKSDDDASVS